MIEVLIVVVILGILAATIIPQFMSTTQDAKLNAAKANVTELENAVERFYIHMDRHPTTEEGLKVLIDPPSGDEKKWRGRGSNIPRDHERRRRGHEEDQPVHQPDFEVVLLHVLQLSSRSSNRIIASARAAPQ